jgi:hypothetical protein
MYVVTEYTPSTAHEIVKKEEKGRKLKGNEKSGKRRKDIKQKLRKDMMVVTFLDCSLLFKYVPVCVLIYGAFHNVLRDYKHL